MLFYIVCGRYILLLFCFICVFSGFKVLLAFWGYSVRKGLRGVLRGYGEDSEGADRKSSCKTKSCGVSY